MNPVANVVAVLTPNPAVDVTYRVAQQRVGHTQRVLDVTRRPGGKGVNVARVLGSVGARSRCLLPLGGPAGRWLAAELAGLDVPATVVPLAGPTRTTVTVVDGVQHPTMFGEPGPAVSAAEWAAVTRAVPADADAFVVAGSLPPGTDPELVGAWIRAAAVPAVADVTGPALLVAAAAGAVCAPNAQELLEATGCASEQAGAGVLLERGAPLVVVSRGAAGLSAHTPGGQVHVPAVAGVSGNPTGAGDAATAGFVLATTRGLPTATALRWAAAFGAAAVLRPVAGEVDLAALARHLPELQLELQLEPQLEPRPEPDGSPA
ncbi:1-phosphofructokinase family hexose kinase [Kineococcus sp. TBRC 1896]|uniref:1-phosphofructokinase family hexose kinase n=1 Tax=Kineococcus mangrovi TaxID=1660183 RepID=A0ABV4HXI8_9ACTN